MIKLLFILLTLIGLGLVFLCGYTSASNPGLSGLVGAVGGVLTVLGATNWGRETERDLWRIPKLYYDDEYSGVDGRRD